MPNDRFRQVGRAKTGFLTRYRPPKLATAGLIAVALAAGVTSSGSGAVQTRDRKAEKRERRGEKTVADRALEAEGANSTSTLALPFRRAWQYLTENASMIAPSVDSDRVYLPLSDGRVICLDRNEGSLLWSSEPGGLISVPVGVGEKAVYIATQKLTAEGAEAGASLRAVDKVTGLTLWVRDYARAFTSEIALAPGRLYIGSADGSMTALAAEGGEVIWKAATQDVVRGPALLTEKLVYFGGDDGALRGVEPGQGREVWKYQTSGKVCGQPASDGRAVYFGSGDGYVYSVDARTARLNWRSRTGAAVEATPILVGDRVLAVSFDNFVYALSRARGDRLWKRRMDNRIASSPIVQGDAAMVAALRGDHLAVFLNADGRRLNFYQLERGFELVSGPAFRDGTLVIPTNKGLVVAIAGRLADAPPRAMKK